MRFRLRTLLIVLAIGPMVLAVGWWWFAEPYIISRQNLERLRQIGVGMREYRPGDMDDGVMTMAPPQ
jgi:hypothetical protein